MKTTKNRILNVDGRLWLYDSLRACIIVERKDRKSSDPIRIFEMTISRDDVLELREVGKNSNIAEVKL